jgi:hypothetical protein
MNEHLKNRLVTLIEKDTPLTPENLQEVFSDGIDKIGTSRDKIDGLIDQVRNSIIQNSVQLLVQRLMSGDKEGVIEILNNNRDVIKLFSFTEKLNELLTEYGWYRNLYNEDYPEIKKIKENLVLKEKDLLPLLTEIINEQK